MIRVATKKDFETIVKFNIALALESEKAILNNDLINKGVWAILEDPTKGIYYVVEMNGEVVGQLLITYEWSDWRNGNWWWIQSAYTHPHYRRQGVFTMLYNYIAAIVASRDDICGIRLQVDENNFKAQNTYTSLKMEQSNYLLFEYVKTKLEK